MVKIICKICNQEKDAKSTNYKYCSECKKQKKYDDYKKWYNNNKNSVSERMKVYNKTYKKTHTEERKKYRKNRKDTDENYYIEQKLRSKLHTFLNIKKKDNYNELFGCNSKDLKKWIEYNFTSNMSWDNYGKYWTLDHVFPVKIFNLKNEDEQKFCFNWKNTRPLYHLKNCSRQYEYFDTVLHELKVHYFLKNIKDYSFNDIFYGISYLQTHSRNCLSKLVNR